MQGLWLRLGDGLTQHKKPFITEADGIAVEETDACWGSIKIFEMSWFRKRH